MAPDPVTQERIYEAIKDDFLAGAMRPGVRIEIQSIADRHRASTTPVREVLHRLAGERLIETRNEGGFRLALPTAVRLAHLYSWNEHLILMALQMAQLAALRDTLKAFRQQLLGTDRLGLVQFIDSFFLAIADCTDNPEIVDQVRNANERLHYVRLAEYAALANPAEEALSLVRNGHVDVRRSMRRRVRDYHRRRISSAVQIMQVVEWSPS